MSIIASLCGFMLCALFGFVRASKLEDRQKAISDFLSDIKQLGLQLEFTLQPCHVLIENMKSVHIHEVWEKLREKMLSGESMKNAWQQIKENQDCFVITSLQTEDIAVLDDFFAVFGTSDLETQKKNLAHIYKQLEELQNTVNLTSAAKIKMFRSLGVLIGLAVAVLLI